MARARNIKPALFKNEVLGVADPLLTLLFEGLWVLADRSGRMEDRPLRIRGEIFPYRDGLDMNAMLDWLQEAAFITRYKVGGASYIQVLNFEKHQNPHKNEPASTIPGADGNMATTELVGTKPAKLGTRTDSVGSTRADSLSSDSLSPDSGYLKGVQGETSSPPAGPTPTAAPPGPLAPDPDPEPGPEPGPGHVPEPKVVKAGSRMVTFKAWYARVTANGGIAIPEGHASFAYAQSVGISRYYLRLHWLAFKRRYSGSSKKYVLWDRVFTESIRGNYFRIWAADNNGEYYLTTIGKQAEREHKSSLEATQ